MWFAVKKNTVFIVIQICPDLFPVNCDYGSLWVTFDIVTMTADIINNPIDFDVQAGRM